MSSLESNFLPPNAPSVEKDANFEGNDSEVLFSRMGNPRIKQQLIDSLYQNALEKRRAYENETWVPYGRSDQNLLKGENLHYVISKDDLQKHLDFNLKSFKKEDVARELEERIVEAKNVTPINFSSEEPDQESISMDWVLPWNKQKPSSKQMSIIEAHEKGHILRPLRSIDTSFSKAFDISAILFTQDDSDILTQLKDKEGFESEDQENFRESLEHFRERYLHDYLFIPTEIIERMSQLKNYFGFKGDEIFTKEHLHYAMKHYIKDTEMDNSMGLFFQAITSEKEDAFLKLINTVGV